MNKTCMLRLKLFGQFELRKGSEPINLSGLKPRALLAYLAIGDPAGETRERMTALLWGSHFEEQARQNFRQALARLRKAVGSETIVVGDQLTKLAPGSIASDVHIFETLIREGSERALREAIGLADGELLAGIEIEQPEWGDWLSNKRRKLANDLDNASLAVGEIEYGNDNGKAALELAESVAGRDFLREDAHRLIMRSLALLGRRTEALKHFHEFSSRLKEELNTAAEAVTVKCYELIRTAPSQPAASAIGSGERPTDRGLVPSGKASIAVLPFANLSGDLEQRYFSDGVTEDIITELSRYHGLFVIARGASFQYRDQAIDVKRVGNELGVRYLVEGSIRKLGTHLRIAVQLIDSGTASHLWAERYDRQLDAVFAIQDEITTAIVAAIAGHVQTAEMNKVRRKRTGNLEAYDCFLRGLEHVNRSGNDDNVPARDMFTRATEIDQDFAQAHSFLALILVEIAWSDVWIENGLKKSTSMLQQALSVAQRAVSIDGNDSLCQSALGWVHLARKSFHLAEHHIGLAIKLNPNDAESIVHRGAVAIYTGRPEEALRSLNLALKLNPAPANYYWVAQGLALYHLSRFAEASSAFERATAWRPYAYRYLAAAKAQIGRLTEARALAAESLRLQPGFTLQIWQLFEPYQSAADLGLMLDGMRKAGLPE